MLESKTGAEKFIIIDRLIFLSTLILTVVVATATTTHPYDKKSYLENPADLLSFENLLKDNPEVPVAGDVKEEPETSATQTEEQEPEEEPEEKPEEDPKEEPKTTSTSRNRSTTPVKTAESTPAKSEQPQPRKSNIDWSVIHVDDNGEYFDDNEPTPITPPATEQPMQPEQPIQPEQPTQPQSPSQPQTDERPIESKETSEQLNN